jgi:cobalt/nickel transport system permease protein
LLFQALIFQYGGLLTLGVNALNMGAGAFAAHLIWQQKYLHETIRTVLAGFIGVVVPAAMMTLEFEWTGYGQGIRYIFSIYIVVAALEGLFTWIVVKFFRKVKSNILN